MNVCIYQGNSHDHLLLIKDILGSKYGHVNYTNKDPNVIVMTEKFLIYNDKDWITRICESKKNNRKFYFYFTEIADYLDKKIDYYNYANYSSTREKLDIVKKYTDVVFTKSFFNPFKDIKSVYIPEYIIFENYDFKTHSSFRDIISENRFLNVVENKKCVMMFKRLTLDRQTIIKNISKYISPEEHKSKNHLGVNGFRRNYVNVYPNYNFSISIENTAQCGYITEKALQPLLGNCIPIYYDPLDNIKDSIINENAMIILKDQNDTVDINKDFSNIHIFKDNALELYDTLIKNVYDVL